MPSTLHCVKAPLEKQKHKRPLVKQKLDSPKHFGNLRKKTHQRISYSQMMYSLLSFLKRILLEGIDEKRIQMSSTEKTASGKWSEIAQIIQTNKRWIRIWTVTTWVAHSWNVERSKTTNWSGHLRFIENRKTFVEKALSYKLGRLHEQYQEWWRAYGNVFSPGHVEQERWG